MTAYHYTSSLRRSGADRLKLGSAFYRADDYRTIVVTWREEELPAALGGGG